MPARSAAEQILTERLEDPEYRAAYELASRRIARFDAIINAFDARRRELGMTKAELARRSNLPPAAVRRLFSQQRKNPTLTTLVAIADALGLAVVAVPAASEHDRPTAAAPVRTDSSVAPAGAPSSGRGTRQRTA